MASGSSIGSGVGNYQTVDSVPTFQGMSRTLEVQLGHCYSNALSNDASQSNASPSSPSLSLPRPEPSAPQSNSLSSPQDLTTQLSLTNFGRQEWGDMIHRTLMHRAILENGLPPKFVPDNQISGRTIGFIMSQYEPLFELVFFRPVPSHMKFLRSRFVMQMLSSRVTHWTMYVGAQMLQTLRYETGTVGFGRFAPWLDRLERLCVASDSDMSLDDLIGRLSGALELTLLRYISSSAKRGYHVMRQVAPLFMQIAFADPTLWPRVPSSNGISLAHALVSPNYELGRFIYVDVVTSVTFGVPPLVEYDTSHPIIRTPEPHPMEWIHGCPSEFAYWMIMINQWRATAPVQRVEQESPWQNIEANVRAWQPRSDLAADSESWRTVMRLMVQEGWRHALLIYLYMGMCNVTNHDPRVESAVQQISKLYSIIALQPSACMHMLTPLLIAAIASKREADRNKFRAIVSQSGDKTWLLKGIDLAAVLDHLWHGVGMNGKPVTWDDYVNSRKALVDIGV